VVRKVPLKINLVWKYLTQDQGSYCACNVLRLRYTKQHLILLFMQKSAMPMAGNNITLVNVNGSAVISHHVEFVLLTRGSRCFSSAQTVLQSTGKLGSMLYRNSFIFFVTQGKAFCA
jgi:hypothetical protein